MSATASIKERRFYFAVLWFVRAVFVISALYFSSFLPEGGRGNQTGRLIIGAFVFFCVLGLALSFCGSRWGKGLFSLLIICVPLAFFLSLDVMVLKGAWWEWCIMFPAQMAIPVALAYHLWRFPR